MGIPAANVRVICQYMGGGFGSKALSVGAEGLLCAKLAKAANAPVKLMLDRKEEHLATGNRPSAASKIKAGVSADGMITAFDAETWGTGGAGATAGFPLPYIYRIANRRRAHKDVFTNTGQQRPMRAPGHPQGSFNTEIMMDELADKVKLDPLEFRLKNLPPEAPNAMQGAYLREGAAEFGWNKRHATGDKTPGPSRRAWASPSTLGAAAAADRPGLIARSRPMAWSSCASGRRISARARVHWSPSSRRMRWDCSRHRSGRRLAIRLRA